MPDRFLVKAEFARYDKFPFCWRTRDTVEYVEHIDSAELFRNSLRVHIAPKYKRLICVKLVFDTTGVRLHGKAKPNTEIIVRKSDFPTWSTMEGDLISYVNFYYIAQTIWNDFKRSPN